MEETVINVDRLSDLAKKLNASFYEQERKARPIHDRMLEDYRSYQGKYSPEEESRFDRADFQGSRAHSNIVRPKTNSFIAKVSDILFPSDDTNFTLRSLDGNVEGAALMEKTISTQLCDAGDANVSRDQIRDGSIFGLGIVKGPVLSNKVSKAWRSDGVSQALVVVNKSVPDLQCIRPWNFFPDMNASRLSDAEFVFERQYLTRGELQDLAKLDGILPTIANALKMAPQDVRDTQLEESMRVEVSELESKHGRNRYELIMYHGPVKLEDLLCSGEYTPEELVDCHDEVSGEIWLIGDNIVKMIINPLDRGEFPYSCWSPEEDDQCIFGYGIPHLLKHPSKIRNSSLRMLLDNAGITAGPQVVVDRKAVEPADGSWGISPFKLWYKKYSDVPTDNAFQVYNITNNQADLSALFKVAREMADDETNMPLVSQSNESGTVLASKTGVVSMVMNAQNVALRLAIKNWDDNVTVPKIRRFYDWNMQYNGDERVKCDCQVSAKGSSELLLKETQATNVGNLVQIAMAPTFAPMTNMTALYKQAVKTLQFDPDRIVLPDEKVAEAAQQPKPPSKEELDFQLKQGELQMQQQKMQLQYQMHQDKMRQQDETRKQKYELAEVELQKVVGQLAVQKEISIEQAAAKLRQVELKIAGDRQLLADETKVKLATGSGL